MSKIYTQKEAFSMLVDGKKMRPVDWNKKSSYLMFNDDDRLVYDDGSMAVFEFSGYVEWEEYQEPRWYDNIPDGGVLCWINGNKLINPAIVTHYNKLDEMPFYSPGCGRFKSASPLTSEEIKALLANAPE